MDCYDVWFLFLSSCIIRFSDMLNTNIDLENTPF